MIADKARAPDPAGQPPHRATQTPTAAPPGAHRPPMPRGTHQPRIATLAERLVAVAPHHGPLHTVEATRRPLYRHLILNELVGGPGLLRFLERPVGDGTGSRDRVVDVLVSVQNMGFHGDDVCTVESLPAGDYAVLDYRGPEDGLSAAREALRQWVAHEGFHAVGPLLQVHLMDPLDDGEAEQEIQIPVQLDA